MMLVSAEVVLRHPTFQVPGERGTSERWGAVIVGAGGGGGVSKLCWVRGGRAGSLAGGPSLTDVVPSTAGPTPLGWRLVWAAIVPNTGRGWGAGTLELLPERG